MQALHRLMLRLMPGCRLWFLSVYVMGLADKKHLAAAYGKALGKAKVTGYCIKFKTLRNIDVAVLEAAVRYGIKQTTA